VQPVVHAWNYRRYVLASMPVPRAPGTELAYTTRKIEANFSNFSAWHQRTKVLPVMWAAGLLDEAKTREKGLSLSLFSLRSGELTVREPRA
jgi:geranylgeranyl transferase type-2 subunit alpha